MLNLQSSGPTQLGIRIPGDLGIRLGRGPSERDFPIGAGTGHPVVAEGKRLGAHRANVVERPVPDHRRRRGTFAFPGLCDLAGRAIDSGGDPLGGSRRQAAIRLERLQCQVQRSVNQVAHASGFSTSGSSPLSGSCQRNPYCHTKPRVLRRIRFSDVADCVLSSIEWITG